MARTVCEEPSCGLVKCHRDQKYLQIGSTGRKCSPCCLCYCCPKCLFPEWPLPRGLQAEEPLRPVREAKPLICWRGCGQSVGEKGRTQEDERLCTQTQSCYFRSQLSRLGVLCAPGLCVSPQEMSVVIHPVPEDEPRREC